MKPECEYDYESFPRPKPRRLVSLFCFLGAEDQEGDINTFIVWSNKLPTEIRDKETKALITLQPKQVAVINDQLVEHRAPKAKESDDRWFVRAWPYGRMWKRV